MKLIFFFFSYVFLTYADIAPCPNGSIQFDPPNNLSTTIYYPKTDLKWPPALFPNNYTCKYQINVPQGLWAYLQISVATTHSFSKTIPVVVTDKLNKAENLFSGKNEVFYLIDGGGNILLTTGMANTSFGFLVQWNKNPSTFFPSYTSLAVADTDPKVLTFMSNSLSVFTAESRVSVVVIPPMSPINYHFLRGVMFYDGPDWNSTFLGSAMEFWKSGNQMITSGNKLTVQYLTKPNSIDGYVVLQEYENTKMIANYQGVPCDSSTEVCAAILLDTSGPSAMVTYVPDGQFYYGETVTSMEGNGTLDVYIGGVTKNQTNLIKSYDIKSSGSHFPQRFNGNIRTYVLRENNAKLDINFNQQDNYPFVQSIGKEGFISSNHYSQKNKSQEVHEYIGVNKLATFSFAIHTADLSSDATCSIVVYNNKAVVYTSDVTNLPTLLNTVQVLGDTLTVDFSSNGKVSEGFYMSYQILNESSNLCFMFAIFLCLIAHF